MNERELSPPHMTVFVENKHRRASSLVTPSANHGGKQIWWERATLEWTRGRSFDCLSHYTGGASSWYLRTSE